MRRLIFPTVFCATLALAVSRQAFAAAGNLDVTFGAGGKVTTDFLNKDDEAFALAIQSDGKIVAAGATDGVSRDFAVARYNSDGALDVTFGDNGRVITDFFGGRDSVYAIAIQSDGKILAVGGATGLVGPDFGLARYKTDGTPDTGFGDGGKVTTDFGRDERADAFAITSDGKIVVVGTTGSGAQKDFALARYHTDGSLDTSFGDNGRVITDFDGRDDRAFALAIQPDGKVVAAGTVTGLFPAADFAVARYNPDGSLDSTFGSDGKVKTDMGNADGAISLIVQADGKIVAAGLVTVGSSRDLAVARYNPDGTLDETFGNSGRIRTSPINFNYATAPALQWDGKIVMAGFDDLGDFYDFQLVRHHADGSLDTTFGSYGRVLTPFRKDSWANAVAIQADGKIVAAGYGDDDFALVRYESGLPPLSNLRLDLASIRLGGSFTATFADTNAFDGIYFDFRFRAPGSETEEVVLNWQYGTAAAHIVGTDTAPGTWTITGVRAHREMHVHAGDFIYVSIPFTVTP